MDDHHRRYVDAQHSLVDGFPWWPRRPAQLSADAELLQGVGPVEHFEQHGRFVTVRQTHMHGRHYGTSCTHRDVAAHDSDDPSFAKSGTSREESLVDRNAESVCEERRSRTASERESLEQQCAFPVNDVAGIVVQWIARDDAGSQYRLLCGAVRPCLERGEGYLRPPRESLEERLVGEERVGRYRDWRCPSGIFVRNQDGDVHALARVYPDVDVAFQVDYDALIAGIGAM